LPRQTVEGYSRSNLTAWVEDNLRNLSTDAIDLLQLHCPPTELYYRPEVFGILDDLAKAGKIRHCGVSVEKVDQALKAIEFPNVQAVQIIFNCFRQRSADLFFTRAKEKRVGILARVSLASGLRTGKFQANSTFTRTTIATSIAMANPLTSAKRSQELTTMSPWRQLKIFAGSCPPRFP
jgi:aryl-alcohol dehydrogenase-like predicted oxidoreductase